jgi:hypothetical protein
MFSRSNGRNALALALVCSYAIAVAAEKEHVSTVPLKEPQIERISSTQYRVTCDSGRKEIIMLKGAPESSAAGPKNQYVLGRARQICWQGPLKAK